jgi:NADP-dependent 3-hydroxy acid dehydrogenase YdfG
VTAAAGIGIGGAMIRRSLADGATVVASDSYEGRVKKLRDATGVDADVVDVSEADALTAHLRAMSHNMVKSMSW